MYEEYQAETDKPGWSGICVGGPLDSQEGASRYPSGFLLVDRPANRVWIYDWSESNAMFFVREAEGSELISDPDAPKNRFRAAEESEFDIRAAEPKTTGEDTRFGSHLRASGGVAE